MSGFQNSFRNRALRDFFTYQTKKMPYHSQVFARNPALGSISGALATLWPCQFLKIPSRHVPENPLSDFTIVFRVKYKEAFLEQCMLRIFLSRPCSVLSCSSRHAYSAQVFPTWVYSMDVLNIMIFCIYELEAPLLQWWLLSSFQKIVQCP